MDANTFGAVKLALAFGAVLAFAFWELFSLRRHNGDDGGDEVAGGAGPGVREGSNRPPNGPGAAS